MAKQPFGLVVRFTLAPGAADGFDRLAADTVAQIRAKEPGTLVYAVHAVDGDPSLRIFYEMYEDRAAFDHHEEQEHVRVFLSEREHYLSDTKVDFLDLRASKGINLGNGAD